MRHTIVVLATHEEVLASVAYMPYWTFTELREAGADVRIFEDITLREFDDQVRLTIPPGSRVLLDVSTAAQMGLAAVVWRKYRHAFVIEAVGYQPFAEAIGIPMFDFEHEELDLLRGVFRMPYHHQQWRFGYATRDSHIVCPGDNRHFVPVFLSVGCKRNCEYCYVTGTNYPYGHLDLPACKEVIDYAVAQGWNLHFEDENFYRHPAAREVVEYLVGKGLKWIAIGDTLSMSRAVREWGVELLRESGHWLSEVGLETAAPDLLRKKQDVAALLECGLNVFWLCVTLLPGETIASLRQTGRWHEKHGMPFDRLLPRLKTQSSHGGLGQFFQPYPGTQFWRTAQVKGKWLTQVPTRLSPSWAPYTLLGEYPERVNKVITDYDLQWLLLYARSGQHAEHLLERCNGLRTVAEVTQCEPDAVATFACLVKLGLVI